MKTAVQQLSNYASYHRDKRNILTHFMGVPMIVFAVVVFLSRPALSIPGLPIPVSVALIAAIVTTIYYIALDVSLGLVLAVVFALFLMLGAASAASSTQNWLMAHFLSRQNWHLCLAPAKTCNLRSKRMLGRWF